jgi:hypothetical protein
MMSNTKRIIRTRVPSEEAKIKYAIDFLEELSWLFESKKKLDLSNVSELLRRRLSPAESVVSGADNYVSPNPNIHYLIGILPRLFQDDKLFSKNDDIADFARDVLGINISRVEKRSKYELIGLIVCETNELNDVELDSMVKALAHIAGNTKKLDLMAKAKTSTGFSWNEAIRKLANQDDA